MDISKIERDYRNRVSDIVIAKTYNVSVKEIRRLLEGKAKEEKPKKENPKKEKRCAYCNEVIESRKKYCQDHKSKSQRPKQVSDTYSFFAASKHQSLSQHDKSWE